MCLQLKYARWQKPLCDAILEHDEQARLTKLQHVETKTRERLQALAHQESNKEEQQALIDAIATIRVFKEPQEIA